MLVKPRLSALLALLFFALVLSGCISKVTSIKVDKDRKLDEEMGYLLMAVDTNVDLKSITVIGERNFKLTSEDLRRGSNYILIDMPEGSYHISQVNQRNWLGEYYVTLEEEYWTVNIERGKVSYIGDMTIRSSRFNLSGRFILVNKSSFALEFMEREFPNILANRTMVYRGPGKDTFLKNVTQKNTSETPFVKVGGDQ